MNLEEKMKDLITELGIDKLDEETQAVVVSQVLDALQKNVGIRLAELLTEEQAGAVEKLDESDDPEAAEAEVRKYVPNYDEIVGEEISALKDEMKDSLNL